MSNFGQRRKYAVATAVDRLNCAFAGRIACVALQQGLGLLPERNRGRGSRDPYHPFALRPYLAADIAQPAVGFVTSPPVRPWYSETERPGRRER